MEARWPNYKVGELNMTPRRRDGQRRYQEVAQEFERLGYEPFMQTYFTPDIKARIKEAARKRPVYGVPDPEADRYAFANAGEITDKWGEKFQINFVDQPHRRRLAIHRQPRRNPQRKTRIQRR